MRVSKWKQPNVRHDLARVSELQYGRIPELEAQLAAADEAEVQEMQLLRNKVTDEEVAEVVARWTGIPVSKMLEGERDKLLRMEEELQERVVGQGEAVKVVSDAIRRSELVCLIRAVRMVLFCFSGQQVSVRPNCVKHWQTSCLIRKKLSCESICLNLWSSIQLHG